MININNFVANSDIIKLAKSIPFAIILLGASIEKEYPIINYFIFNWL